MTAESALAVKKFSRILAGTVLLVTGLNAFGGGWYGMSGAPGVTLAWLEGSPFDTFFIPSLFLFIVIGGSCLTAGILIFRKSRFSRMAAILSGALLICWIAIQVAIIGYVSWLQPAVVIAGSAVLLLSGYLPSNSKSPGQRPASVITSARR